MLRNKLKSCSNGQGPGSQKPDSFLLEVQLLAGQRQLGLGLSDALALAALEGGHLVGTALHLRVLVASDGVELQVVKALQVCRKIEAQRIEISIDIYSFCKLGLIGILVLISLLDSAQPSSQVLLLHRQLRPVERLDFCTLKLINMLKFSRAVGFLEKSWLLEVLVCLGCHMLQRLLR